ncbi:MAG TPA: GMC oxidoreductase [Opitutaceae bacterium]|jgi:choline dehydrogenase-like flavoprotein|nr:GMC oxidoreductase [Opitutaceae bacterium]
MPINILVDSGQPIQPPPDVQRTTLGLDVLSRFVCNTWDEAANNGGAPFDAVIIGAGMFGGYCADKIYRDGAARGLRVLVLDAGPFLVPTHVQNLPRAGLNVPGPLYPANDPGTARELVWGMPWRSNVDFIGQAYCVGGKSLYWGGWCPRLQADDLSSWPPTVAQYLVNNYPALESQTGVTDKTEFIQGNLYSLLKTQISGFVSAASIANLNSVEDPPLAVQGQSPASGLFSFDKYSSVTLLIDAVRETAGQPDSQRRLFVVPNTHVTHLETSAGVVTGLHASVNGQARYLPIASSTSVVLALGTIESTRLALLSFPTGTGGQPERIGRNLISHVRSNMYFQVRRSALDPTNILPLVLETGALLVRGSTPQGKFHLQVTASADPAGNSDALLYTMIPDVDQLDAILAGQQAGWISFAFRGSSQLQGDTVTPIPNGTGRWINLSPYESDEFGLARAYAQFTTTPAENTLADAMDQAMVDLANRLANGNAADLNISYHGRDALGTTYHEAGTMWMGTTPATSITDPNGRFHHVQNAYCADQSLFVTVGSVNPTLTGLTLTRKVAEAIVARATGAPPPP